METEITILNQPKKDAPQAKARISVSIQGSVQGVGFRPFIYRLAHELGLSGWVSNDSSGLQIEAEGRASLLDEFLERIRLEHPKNALISSFNSRLLDAAGYSGFEILPSLYTGEKSAGVIADISTCPECLREIFDPSNHRYLYPFTNCTDCGPRFSIIKAIPYDRSNTTMSVFPMCKDCRQEYASPSSRRFHAQPNACPVCGPHVEYWDSDGNILFSHHKAILACAAAIRRGEVVALKGIGGFHLIVDARNTNAVNTLRLCKDREEKPFALMYPDIASLKRDCRVSGLEEDLLKSAESPIVILKSFKENSVSQSVAPGNPYFGAMLPYSPLHHILMRELGFPVVATSANISDEPICTNEKEALARLRGIASHFLVHNRPIERHVDDSIARVALGRPLILRRARGFAPEPVLSEKALPGILAFGAHLKNTTAISIENKIFISQHIGDLETEQSVVAFRKATKSLQSLYEHKPRIAACDAHPDYFSTHEARDSGLAIVEVQHHYAHILSCMSDNDLEGPCLGIAWDGTGYGLDGTIWGGEFLEISDSGFSRMASFRTFCLPGGEVAVREPRRSALGLLYEIYKDAVLDLTEAASPNSFSKKELELLVGMLKKGINSPVTSSIGRLFDGVSSILGIRQVSRFEAQPAMELEFACEGSDTEKSYDISIKKVPSPNKDRFGPSFILDWEVMIKQILNDVKDSVEKNEISRKFHNALANSIVSAAKLSGERKIVLSGGCFQNQVLTDLAVQGLRRAGFEPYWHRNVPSNDGGISLGQIEAASRILRQKGI